MADRRQFLRGLATLPLIGGSVAVLSPVAAIAKGSANDATLIACCDKLRGILAAQRDLCRAYPGIDCDKTPGWDETEEGRAAVLAQVTEMPAASLRWHRGQGRGAPDLRRERGQHVVRRYRPVDRRRRPPAAQRGRGAQRCRVPAGQRPRPWLSPSSTASAPRACLSN